MQPDNFRLIVILKMTLNRVAHHFAQFLKRVTFGEYGNAKRARCNRLRARLRLKNYLVHKSNFSDYNDSHGNRSKAKPN